MIKTVGKLIEDKKNEYFELSDSLWNTAEVKYHEKESAKTIINFLEKKGFKIETNIADIETAFIGTYGDKGPVIGFLGEYDALPELNQKSGSTIKEADPSLGTTNGHGCGHNLLGTASVAAAIATRDYLKENNLDAQIRFYGCPAEEGGSGKTYMVRSGAFDDVDMAICWHPGTDNAIISSPTLANIQTVFEFKGTSSHAANSPHMGRSALDAMELMNVGANYLREHVTPEARYHYAVLDGGGFQPSVVQAHAKSLYLIRAPKAFQVKDIYDRLVNCAKGAALMTGTEVEVHFDKACSDYMPNIVLSKLMSDTMFEVGAPNFDEDDIAFAKELHASLSEDEKKFMMVPPVTSVEKKVLSANQGKFLADYIYPFNEALTNVVMPGSTDVADVSWVVPTVQCVMATEVMNTALHSWQWVANGKSPIAKKGMLQVAKVMASTAIKAIENPEYLEQAKAELDEALIQTPYVNPIPLHVKPNSLEL